MRHLQIKTGQIELCFLFTSLNLFQWTNIMASWKIPSLLFRDQIVSVINPKFIYITINKTFESSLNFRSIRALKQNIMVLGIEFYFFLK